MGVFGKRNIEQQPQQENNLCAGGHRWDGEIPTVKGNLHEVQNPDLIGRRCDCGAFVYAQEGLCGCPGEKYWKIYFD